MRAIESPRRPGPPGRGPARGVPGRVLRRGRRQDVTGLTVNEGVGVERAADLGLGFEIATISNSSEVQTAAEALVARGVDVFFVSTDSTESVDG